jgi:hypothetical protein
VNEKEKTSHNNQPFGRFAKPSPNAVLNEALLAMGIAPIFCRGIGAMAVVVDPINEYAVKFYE